MKDCVEEKTLRKKKGNPLKCPCVWSNSISVVSIDIRLFDNLDEGFNRNDNDFETALDVMKETNDFMNCLVKTEPTRSNSKAIGVGSCNFYPQSIDEDGTLMASLSHVNIRTFEFQ
ncbi:hypothetical protein TNCV_2037271 [Trichonephila clavipes]|nr:hypothetical protein TNCV_2037271 [Trichonephila clavipes]